MLNRHYIRTKVFKVLFSRVHNQSMALESAEKELLMSCERSYDLYWVLLNLPVALKKYAQLRIDFGLNKNFPTFEDLHPNLNFVNNSVINFIESDEVAKEHFGKVGFHWEDWDVFIKSLFSKLQESEAYQNYMALESPTLKNDIALIRYIYDDVLLFDDSLDKILEGVSLYWIDDVAYVCGVILKVLSKLSKQSKTFEHPKPWNVDALTGISEEKDFARKLLQQSLIHYEDYTALIKNYAEHYELDRIASSDIVIMVMGIAEAVYFKSIPVKVTINEMVELSKYYSTPKSKSFVNGILDKVISTLSQDGTIVKEGRGLIG